MNPEGKLVMVKILVIIGFAFIAFGLTLAIVTYVIPSWVIFNVSATSSNSDAWERVSRTRGIFQECTLASGVQVKPSAQFIKKNDCFDNDIGQYTMQYNSSDRSYMMIIRMRQSQLVLHGISLVLSLVILLVGFGIILKWCCVGNDSVFYIKWRLSLGIISILIVDDIYSVADKYLYLVLLMAASASLGTGLAFIESNSTYKTPLLPYSEFNVKVPFTYGPMYILAWVSSGFSLISSVLFLISVCLGANLEEEKYKPRLVSVDNPSFNIDSTKKHRELYLAPSTDKEVIPNDSISPGLLPRYNVSN